MNTRTMECIATPTMLFISFRILGFVAQHALQKIIPPQLPVHAPPLNPVS